jgi:hypothetical protein
LLASEIVKMLYAPHKAFKEIMQNPRYMGPLLIMLLFVAANAGFTYVATSKTYIEQVLPNGSNLDEWTENSTFWQSNAQISESNDFINGTYYGNKSIAFSITDSTEIWVQLTDIGSISCSGPDGYTELSFRIKWTSPQTRPVNGTIYMFSTTSSDFFYESLGEIFANLTYNIWNNLTIPLVSDGWLTSSPSADWGNVTGLKLIFQWPESTNITLLIDGLFFHGPFESLYATAGTAYILNYALVAVMQYVITWVFLSGIIYIMSKSFGGKLVWKTILVLIGFALITMFVQAIVNAAAYATVSSVNYPFQLIVGVEGETDAPYNAILDQTATVSYIGRFTQIAVYIWTIALCSLAVRLHAGFSWTKSILVGVVAYLVTILVIGFILGM